MRGDQGGDQETGVQLEDQHRLLDRQLRRVGIVDTLPDSAQWQALLARVDNAYRHADRVAETAERTLAASSDEMRGRLDEVQQRTDDLVAMQQHRLRVVFDASATAMVMFDLGGRVVAVNLEAERLLGEHHTLVDRHLDEVLMIGRVDDEASDAPGPLLPRADLDEALQDGRWQRDSVSLRAGSAVVCADVTIVRFAADDPGLGGVVVIANHGDPRRDHELLALRASHDTLTGLVDRAVLTERIEQSLAQARRDGDWPSVLLVDLDRFKSINDLLGHAFGDRLLVAAAERLQRCVRSTDTVARLAGDEFVILCHDPGNGDELYDTAGRRDVAREIDRVRTLAERVLLAMAEPFDLGIDAAGDHGNELGGELTSITASIGIVHASTAYQSPESLLHDADLAVSSAKQQGRNCTVVADDRLRVDGAERSMLERGLRSALARREIGVAYQPVHNAATNELVGFEALARWVHPVLGDVRPYRFLAVAEESGLIQALGDRMLDLACRDVATWNRERKTTGLPPIVVHVNISSRELLSPNLLTRVRDAMRRHAVLPSWIMLEMTETTLLDDPDTALERLRELKRAGVRVAIDDFGTGYSSLAHLRRYPVHMVKIDREFIAEIASSKQDQSIVKAMIDLARGMDHEVLAEGVETNAELDVLRSMGCGLVQGYLLGMPMPSEDALLLATSCRTRTPDLAPSASGGTAHLQPQP